MNTVVSDLAQNAFSSSARRSIVNSGMIYTSFRSVPADVEWFISAVGTECILRLRIRHLLALTLTRRAPYVTVTQPPCATRKGPVASSETRGAAMGISTDHHLRGIFLSGAGMLLMGPNTLLLRLVTTAGPAPRRPFTGHCFSG